MKPRVRCSHALVLECSSVFGPVAEQLHDLGDGGGEHGEAHRQEQHLEPLAQGRDAEDVSVTWPQGSTRFHYC